ncbi:MAG TPA: EAL domain-containing protein, partial [Vicinamibacteria bacterium]
EIVRTIVELGHHLDMRVVAEGVETDEQLAVLKAIGCDDAQGYLFSPPVPPAAVAPLVES